jgi:hypothetical protein
LRNQKRSGSHDLSLYLIVSNKGVKKILNGVSELFTSIIKMSLLHCQDEFEFRSFRKSTVMEISIGKDPMESVCITVPRLVQENNGLEGSILFSQTNLEGIWDLCFGLSSEAN